MVCAAKQHVTLNKPITVGFAILEISKLIMCQLYYDYLKPTYGNNCKLLFTDTDSFCCHIQTDDLYGDMARHISEKKNEKAGHYFDTSNFEKDHPFTPMKITGYWANSKAKPARFPLLNLLD